MTLQQLEYALAVDTHRHFGKAAEACFVTQATLSAMIKKLEDELKVVLFDRRAHPILTTDSGKEILEEAKKVLAHSRILMDKAANIHDKIEGAINIGIIPTVASSLLPLVLPQLLKNYPLLRLNIREFTTASIMAKLKTGDIDMGILATPLHDTALEWEVLYYESLAVYGEISQRDNKKYLLPKELQQQKIWLLEEGHCLRAQFINLCQLEKHHQTPDNLLFEGSSFDTLMNMADSFGGLTLLPELYMRFLDEKKQDKILAFQPPTPVREISIAFYSPYAKQRIIARLAKDIAAMIRPLLKTDEMQPDEMHLVEI
jgi:LysR family transcriptional regulator, hydrogen peroxide-inducible genes activator